MIADLRFPEGMVLTGKCVRGSSSMLSVPCENRQFLEFAPSVSVKRLQACMFTILLQKKRCPAKLRLTPSVIMIEPLNWVLNCSRKGQMQSFAAARQLDAANKSKTPAYARKDPLHVAPT